MRGLSFVTSFASILLVTACASHPPSPKEVASEASTELPVDTFEPSDRIQEADSTPSSDGATSDEASSVENVDALTFSQPAGLFFEPFTLASVSLCSSPSDMMRRVPAQVVMGSFDASHTTGANSSNRGGMTFKRRAKPDLGRFD
jgi:hypothetical protein